MVVRAVGITSELVSSKTGSTSGGGR